MSNKPRVPMPLSRRAKQFQPFDALKGFREAIEATERFTEPRRDLTEEGIEELNDQLSKLKPGSRVTLEYYSENEKRYFSISGEIHKINRMNETIEVAKEIIAWYNICNITILL